MGHKMDSCPRDPNLRTSLPVKNEMARVEENQNFKKKTNSDSYETVHKFFNNIAHNRSNSVFGHGGLIFEDYNYNNINKEIFALEKDSNHTEEASPKSVADSETRERAGDDSEEVHHHLLFSPS